MKIDNRVDPDLLKALEVYFEFYKDLELNPESLATARLMGAEQAQELKTRLPKIEAVTQEDQIVPGPVDTPGIRIRIYKPKDQTGTLPGFLWSHGGGYAMGSIDADDYPNKLRVKHVVCVIVSVDY